ncbi:hypothetical protein UlMin_035925 [Ulmus minor]
MQISSNGRLREILYSLSQENSVLDLIKFLDSISEAALSIPDQEDAINKALFSEAPVPNPDEVLSQVYKHICSSSLDEETVDALSFEMPKVASRFAVLSDNCLEIAEKVIDQFVSTCDPRAMLSILCEALDSPSQIKESAYYAPLLNGLSKVFLSIQRRQFEQLKVAVPVVLKVLKTICFEPNTEDTELKNVLDRALRIANSIHAVCTKLEESDKLRALLGLYILQIMALVSFGMGYKVLSFDPLVSQLSSYFPCCGLSYLGLITGSDVDRMTSILVGGDEDDFMSCLPYVKHGAALSVIWGHISDGAAMAAKEDLVAVKDELQNDKQIRWQAIGMLKHVLASFSLPSELKKDTIDFLLTVTEGNISQKCDDEDTDFLSYMPSLFVALQAVQKVMMYSSDAPLKRNAFDAFKRILADIPNSQRFDILQVLITNSDSSSLSAILLDIVKEELHMEISQRTAGEKDKITFTESKMLPRTLFWTPSVLELVKFVLRPPKGGPPSFPEHGDMVLSALNLYRYILITESTGKTNYTGVLSRSTLLKAYNEWLLPLRTLVEGIMAENKNDYDQFAVDAICSINPVELVLYRCIELVEENMKHYALAKQE